MLPASRVDMGLNYFKNCTRIMYLFQNLRAGSQLKKNEKNKIKWEKMKKKMTKKSKKKTISPMHYPIIALMHGSHGLSARRAWRTLSSRPEGPKAGPKGRSLEVGARRAPRLLVIKYCDTAKRAPSAANNISINAVYLEQNHATSTLRRFTKPRPTSGI